MCGSRGKSKRLRLPKRHASKRDIGYGSCRKESLSDFRTHDPCRLLAYDAMSCGSTEGSTFRIIYRADADAVVILDVVKKKTEQTPQSVVEICRRRLRDYDRVMES